MNTAELLNIVKTATGKSKVMLTIAEFADIAGYSYGRIWQACHGGKLMHVQNCVGGHIKIHIRELGRVMDGKVIL
ncbi:hypothetical protein [Corynebacterium ulcerans]|uniref:hypothetical protein n=1 Tax=Corynebacterium ulcerans TaxID=65058 RepID=UPI0018D62BB8|nr:hypothetical protein [Corynebacterium ulcerans]MBH5303500.1 hypothetical protein [Corynebacterium ulcerans]